MRALIAKMHVVCIQEKSHVVVGGGYVLGAVSHNMLVMSIAYAIAALMTTHLLNRSRTSELRHTSDPRD